MEDDHLLWKAQHLVIECDESVYTTPGSELTQDFPVLVIPHEIRMDVLEGNELRVRPRHRSQERRGEVLIQREDRRRHSLRREQVALELLFKIEGALNRQNGEIRIELCQIARAEPSVCQ